MQPLGNVNRQDEKLFFRYFSDKVVARLKLEGYSRRVREKIKKDFKTMFRKLFSAFAIGSVLVGAVNVGEAKAELSYLPNLAPSNNVYSEVQNQNLSFYNGSATYNNSIFTQINNIVRSYGGSPISDRNLELFTVTISTYLRNEGLTYSDNEILGAVTVAYHACAMKATGMSVGERFGVYRSANIDERIRRLAMASDVTGMALICPDSQGLNAPHWYQTQANAYKMVRENFF